MQDYRSILQDELKQRVAKNRRFTMRAFANLLELNSGSLSSILKGKRTLPRTHWQLCCDKLNFSPEKKTKFLASLAQQFKLEPMSFQESLSEKPNTALVSESQFAVLSEWEFAAVLSLMDIEGFKFSAEEIQKYLNVSAHRAETVFNHLLVSRLVEFKHGEWCKSIENFKTTEDIQSRALALGHANELNLAQMKLQELSVHEREFSSITFAGSSKELRRMKIWLRKMADEFDRKFDKKDGDQVFLLGLQLFPLSQKLKKVKK